MKHLKIDKDIPIPIRAVIPNTFRVMKKGDSVFIKDKTLNQISSFITRFRKSNKNYKFLCRTQGEGIRVWRIE